MTGTLGVLDRQMLSTAFDLAFDSLGEFNVPLHCWSLIASVSHRNINRITEMTRR